MKLKIEDVSLVVLVCDNREETVTESINNSDWSGEVTIVQDSKYTTETETYSRVQDAFRGILEDFIQSDHKYLLYLEDDVTVNKHLWHNIKEFPLVKNEEVDWLVLCDFGSEGEGYVITEKSTTAGAQGLLISRRAAETALAVEWDYQFDKMIPRYLRDNSIPIHKYIPSIVQHNTGTSAIGGEETVLFSPDFDINFKWI